MSASIPIAVLAISVLKKLGGSTILENNIVQTIGSAGESVAGGVVFTIPALIFLLPYGPNYFNYLQITMLTLAGGILGVLMMVPLRRALIVKEHGVLPYPEGTACAEVLVAGERGGKLASLVFAGLGAGALWKSLSWIFNLFRTEIGYSMPRTSQFPNATLNVDVSPEYLGVGYVIGPRIAGTMVAGGVLSWLVLLPLLSILGSFITEPFPPIHPNFANNPATGRPFLISEMSPGQLWSAYIRYIGAGAVLASGLITLARTIPDDRLVGSRELQGPVGAAPAARPHRTERDIPMAVVLGGSLLLAVFLVVTPGLPTQGNVVAAVLILVFGFFFATVSSRITGLIGSSSNPISGMTIATLILTCLLFVGLGWTGDVYAPDRALRRRHRLHRGGQRRHNVAGPQDRLHRRRHALLSAARPDHRRARLGLRHRHDDDLHAPGVRHRIGGRARAAGHADGDDHPRACSTRTCPGAWCWWACSSRSRSSSAASTRCRLRSARTCRSPRPRRSSPAAWCAGGWSGKPASHRSPTSAPARCSARASSPAGRSPASSSPSSSAPARSRRSRRLGDFFPCLHEEGLVGKLADGLLFLALAVIVARAACAKWNERDETAVNQTRRLRSSPSW